MVSVIVLNNSDEVQKGEIKSFIDEKINIVKTVEDYNSGTFGEVFAERIKGFVIIAFLSTTLIGVPLAYFCVAKRGFSIGYTIASIYATQSTKTAIIFICNSMLFHNIIYMASIFLVFVAGNNFIKAIIDQDRKNIRFEIVNTFHRYFLNKSNTNSKSQISPCTNVILSITFFKLSIFPA